MSFINKIFQIGSKRPLEQADLGTSTPNLKSKVLYDLFEREWSKECAKPDISKRSFFKATIRATGVWRWVLAIFLNIVGVVLSFVPTIILNMLVQDIEGTLALSSPSSFPIISSYYIPNCYDSHSLLHTHHHCTYQLCCSNDFRSN